MKSDKRLHKATASVPRSVRMDVPLLEAVRRFAAQEKRTVNNAIRVLLSEALAARKAA